MNIRMNADNLPLVAIAQKVRTATSIIPRNIQWILYIASLILSDTVMTYLALLTAYYFRFELFVQYFDPKALVSFEKYRVLIFFMPIIRLVIFAVNGLYVKSNLLGGTREYSKVFTAAGQGFLLVVIAGFLEPTLIIARGWVVLAWLITFLFVAVGRFFWRRVIYALRRRGFYLTPAVIVGANQEGRWLAEQLIHWETSGLHLVGFVDNKEHATVPLFNGLTSLGSVEKLGEIIERYNIGEVILASSAFTARDGLTDIFRKYGVTDKVNIRMSSGVYEIMTNSLSVSEFAYVPLVYVNKVRLTGSDNVMKFILDFVIAIACLIFLFPALMIIALLVKTSSPGPILHKRLVMGLNGKQFHAYKFRTMVTNGDEILEKHPVLKEELVSNHKLKNDPRVTRIGAFLRKFSLDELPQIINVLKRDMSLVGPRMISPEELSMYKQFDMNLLAVLPGMTGLWQVSGRSDVSYDERVRLDIYYVRNWSIWLDLQILFQTIPAVVKRRGAY